MEINDNYFKHRGVQEGYYQNYIIPKHTLSVLPINKNASILDIGCGLGQFILALNQLGYQNCLGVDVSEEAITGCAKSAVNAQKIDSIVQFAQGHNAKYDFIIMSHVLEHLPKEIVIETLAAIRTYLLKDGGKLFILVPNGQSNTGAYWMYEDFTHYTLYTAGSLRYVLNAAGYETVGFINPDGTQFMLWWKKGIIKFLLMLYAARIDFWNLVTQSSYHKPSERIYTFELKALAC